ncbi:MAG: TIGR01841 family phasin [Pseudomonadota bacterium]
MAKKPAPKDDIALGMQTAEEMMDTIKSAAEKSVNSAKQSYKTAIEAAEDFQETMSQNVTMASNESTKLSLAAIEKMRQNADDAYEHMQKMSAVKSLSEAMELQSAYLRQQAERAVENAKEFQAAAQEASAKIKQPAQDMMDKVIKQVSK